jgi:hypothetical protein
MIEVAVLVELPHERSSRRLTIALNLNLAVVRETWIAQPPELMTRTTNTTLEASIQAEIALTQPGKMINQVFKRGSIIAMGEDDQVIVECDDGSVRSPVFWLARVGVLFLFLFPYGLSFFIDSPSLTRSLNHRFKQPTHQLGI